MRAVWFNKLLERRSSIYRVSGDTRELKHASRVCSARHTSQHIPTSFSIARFIVGSSIVVVPGLVEGVSEWLQGSQSTWTNIGSSLSSPVAVFAFEHDITLGGSFQWQYILDGGPDLLHHVVTLRQSNEALCLACQQPDQYRALMTTVAGACFLGTPHSRSDDVDAWKPVKHILSSKAPALSKQPFSSGDAAILAGVSRRFEEADLQSPVLSICENKGTKIKSAFRPTKRNILVDHTLARIDIKNEKMLEVNLEHHELCNIPKDSFAFEELLKFINTSFEESNLKISSAVNDQASSSLEHSTTSPSNRNNSSLGGYLETADMSMTMANLTTGENASSIHPFDPISNVTDFTPSKKLARLPCYLINSTPSPKFFGRSKILRTLDDELLPSAAPISGSEQKTKSLRTYALCAPGGMGKTQIAGKFLQTRKKSYDAVFWINSDGTSKLAEGFSRIARELRLVEEGSTNARDQIITRDLVKAWLANPMKQTPSGPVEADWLIVFDNVEDPDLLNDFWPVDGTGSILVTSRNPLAKTNVIYAGTSGIDLQPFSTEDAAQLLLQLTERQKMAKQFTLAHAVAARLGGFPLAITQMANTIVRQHLSFEEFLSRYNKEEDMDELHRLRLGTNRESYTHTLATVWEFDRLEHGAALLEVLSCMDPDKIYEFILTKGALKVKLSGYPATERDYHTARYELLQSSLVSRSEEQDRLLIHRVIQDAAKARMKPQRLAEVFEATVELLRDVYPPSILHQDRSPARWIQCEPLFPNIIRLKELYKRLDLPSTFIRARLAFAEILIGAGWFHHDHDARNSTAADCFPLAQEICEAIDLDPGDDKTATEVCTLLGDIHYSRGSIASETNDADMSMKHFGAFVEKRRTLSSKPGGKDKDIYLAAAYNEEGIACMMNGRYQEAKHYFHQSMDTYKSLLEFSRPMMSLPMVNLGLAHWLLGDFDEALEVLDRALLDREQAFGVDDTVDFKTGRILHALGNVKMSQGKLDESFRYHERALRQYRESIGNSHHRTADVCHRLADHYVRLDKSDVSINLLNQAIKIWGDKRHYRPERARTSYKKSLVLKSMGNEEEAQKCLRHALALRRELVPNEVRPDDSLEEADFDKLVVFWSK